MEERGALANTLTKLKHAKAAALKTTCTCNRRNQQPERFKINLRIQTKPATAGADAGYVLAVGHIYYTVRTETRNIPLPLLRS